MAAVKVDLPLVNSVKSGSVTVNKIMHGENRIWPMFPIVLKLNDVYYDVIGIQNNEYIKNIIPPIRCYLAKVYSSFVTGIYQDTWMNVEACISSFKNAHVAMALGSNNTVRDFECFQAGTNLHFDYLAANSSGSSFNRLSLSISSSPYTQIYDTTNLDNKWILEYTTNESEQKKYIKVKRFGETNYLLSTSKACYIPNVSYNGVIVVPNPDNGLLINMYYVKLFDKNKKLISFCHLKDNNGQCMMYDEILKKFLEFSSERTTSGNIIYDDKYVDVEPIISDYYEVSGTITDSSDTYERLVNNKTGVVLKGIKIES